MPGFSKATGREEVERVGDERVDAETVEPDDASERRPEQMGYR